MGSKIESWTIDLSDGFVLSDASGRHVNLPQRKAAELLLALVQAGAAGVSRDLVAEQLWPIATLAGRRTNFRQSLSLLKKTLGAEAIVSNRSTCTLRAPASIRVLSEAHSGPPDLGPTQIGPLAGYVQFIECLAKHHPGRMFDELRANRDFTYSLPPSHLSQIVSLASVRMGATHPDLKWAYFWKAVAVLNSSVAGAIVLFERALDLASESGDTLLVREAACMWALSEMLAGRPRSAMRLADRAEAANRHDNRHRSCEVSGVRSSALLHLGMQDDALLMLERQNDYSQSSVLEVAKNEALRALYSATSGKFKLAEQINEYPTSISTETGAHHIHVICRLTRGYIQAKEEPDNAIDSLRVLVADCEARGFSHIALYAQETVALAHHEKGEVSDAKKVLSGATKLRKDLGFGYTKWDGIRLRRLASIC